MLNTAIESATIIGSFLVQHFCYRQPLPSNFNPNKILVVKLDHLGDVLLATPVFSNLRRAYPKAQIHALVGSWGVDALQNHLDVDAIFQYDASFFCRSGHPTRLREAIRLFHALRQRKYELLIDLRGDWLAVIFALFKSAAHRQALASLQVANKLGYARFTDFHEVERNLDVLRSAHIPTPCRTPVFHTTFADRRWADAFLDQLGVVEGRPLVAIHPASPIALKRWPTERFAAVSDWLIEKKQAQIIFVGVRSELPVIAEIQKQMVGESMEIAGETTLSQLAEILKRCDLFIGNDSGPMHLAAAVGTWTIGLYGPGDPNRFGPVGSHCQTIRRKPDCPPCMEASCKFGGEGCMKEIEVTDVIQMAESHFRHT
ncbi:MAG: lipopolysaccharide heptosyltransferase II [Candidatus Poribacteria bacterium]|nr:lipopolysaccharide heptosyltransferase II [Candidatus Poribacteria bacterium]